MKKPTLEEIYVQDDYALPLVKALRRSAKRKVKVHKKRQIKMKVKVRTFS